jgi:hypothetical protein
MKVVVFDFDKTLTYIDSGFLFCICNLMKPHYLLRYLFHREAFVHSYERKKNYYGLPKAILKLNIRNRMLAHLKFFLDGDYKVILLTGSCHYTINDYSGLLPLAQFDKIYTLEDFLAINAPSLLDGKLKILEQYPLIYYFVNDNPKEINSITNRTQHWLRV